MAGMLAALQDDGGYPCKPALFGIALHSFASGYFLSVCSVATVNEMKRSKPLHQLSIAAKYNFKIFRL